MPKSYRMVRAVFACALVCAVSCPVHARQPAQYDQASACRMMERQVAEAARLANSARSTSTSTVPQRFKQDGRDIRFVWNGDHVVIASTTTSGEAIPSTVRTKAGVIAEIQLQGDLSDIADLSLECDDLQMNLHFNGPITESLSIKAAFID